MTVRKTMDGEYILTSLNNKGNKFISDTSTNEEELKQNESYKKSKQELGVSKTLKFPKNVKRPNDSKVEVA